MKAFGENKSDTARLDGLSAGKVFAEKPPASLAVNVSSVHHAYTDDAGKTKVISICFEPFPFSRLERSLVPSPVQLIYDNVSVENNIKKRGPQSAKTIQTESFKPCRQIWKRPFP